MSLHEDMIRQLATYWNNKGKLELASGTLGLLGLLDSQTEQQKNREAESSWVRRSLWGSKEAPASEADEMGHRITFGDQTHYHTEAAPKPAGGGLAKLLLGAGLLATGAGVPAGAWLVADAIRNAPAAVIEAPATPATPQQPAIETPAAVDADTQYELRLGH